jgi:hypothetical protein
VSNTSTANLSHCPGSPSASFVVSTKTAWKNALVCQYSNGSLWKAGRIPQVGLFAATCHSLTWIDENPTHGLFVWCREGASKAQCVSAPTPAPVPTPGPVPTPAPAPTPAAHFPLYGPLPPTSVQFTSTDKAFGGLLAHAEDQEALNVHPFLASPIDFPILVEGAQFHAAWLETQPMGGAMYATRNMRIAVNNQLVFMRTQRADGALPGQVREGSFVNGQQLTRALSLLRLLRLPRCPPSRVAAVGERQFNHNSFESQRRLFSHPRLVFRYTRCRCCLVHESSWGG